MRREQRLSQDHAQPNTGSPNHFTPQSLSKLSQHNP